MKFKAKMIMALALPIFLGACSGHKPVSSTAKTIVVKPHSLTRLHKQFHRVNPAINDIHPTKMPGLWTVEEVLQVYGPYVKNKLDYYFSKAKVSYPPREMTLIAFKQERKLELWARDNGEFRFIRDYFIMTTNGVSGPKLHQGDRQVPEGIYRITKLNPNSRFHLSMRINYPNEFDLFHAEKEGRSHLGSDIYIHGKTASIGCLAMGDKTIEELFVLTALVGAENVKVVIAPHDPKSHPLIADSDELPEWTSELYSNISREIDALSPLVKSPKLDFNHQEGIKTVKQLSTFSTQQH